MAQITKSPYPLISVADAQSIVVKETAVLPLETMPLSAATGRILAEAVHAVDDLPPFPASIKVKSLPLTIAICPMYLSRSRLQLCAQIPRIFRSEGWMIYTDNFM
jgi:hypothetical protein